MQVDRKRDRLDRIASRASGEVAARIVVIFRATTGELNEDYFVTAHRLRELARSQFACWEFIAMTEGDQELAISYWPNSERLQAWREHPDHVAALRQAGEQWYRSWQVQVAQVVRQHHSA